MSEAGRLMDVPIAREDEVMSLMAGNQMEELTEEDSDDSNRNFKRKWKYDKYKPEESQPKKVKFGVCASCAKKHSDECLKGKDVCYRCGQKGHFVTNCPKSRKKHGCFKCGSLDHEVSQCIGRKVETGERRGFRNKSTMRYKQGKLKRKKKVGQFI